MTDLFAITGGILFGLGVFQLLRRDLIKTGMGFYILFAAINFLFLAVGVYDGNQPAYVYPDESYGSALYLDETGQLVQGTVLVDEEESVATPSDPLVQALILTAIVISFGSYALFLGMIHESSRRFKTINADNVNGLQK
jgi:Multisubunit Na+/H+ antiporter, MnhC subunit